MQTSSASSCLDPCCPLHAVSVNQPDLCRGSLGKKTAYVESPRSTLSHLISNVRAAPQPDGLVTVRARFIVHRSRGDEIVHFFGHVHYRLRPQEDTFKIVSKRCILDFNSLTHQGKLAILL